MRCWLLVEMRDKPKAHRYPKIGWTLLCGRAKPESIVDPVTPGQPT